jgi:hypothetical protein
MIYQIGIAFAKFYLKLLGRQRRAESFAEMQAGQG